MLEQACAGLWLKPGLRKTSITLGALKVLKKEGAMRRTLVIAPVRVCYSVWPAEVKKWTDFNGFRVEVLHGLKKDEALRRDADIYLINPEGLDWLLGTVKTKVMRKAGRKIPFDVALVGQPGVSVKTEVTYSLKNFKLLGADVLVIDEASKFRKPSTDRFAALKQVLATFDRRIALTGSPAPKWLLDLFGIMYVIDMGRSLGPYITHYRRAYFTPEGYGGYDWVPRPGAKEEIYERIAPLLFSLDDKDYVQMPKLVEIPVYVDLDAKARKLYDELEKEFFTLLEDGTEIIAANAGVASVKCRQVASGGIYLQPEIDDQGRRIGKRAWQPVHAEKVLATRNLVDEMFGNPVLVAYDFEHDLERLLAEFGKDTAVIGGGITPKKSDQIIGKWNAGELPILLGHPAAMAHGLNGQEGNANHIIVHSPNPDFELYDQFIRRLLRSGNTSTHVFVHVIIARDTVDEVTWQLLESKDTSQRALMLAINEYSKARRGIGLTMKARRTKARK